MATLASLTVDLVAKTGRFSSGFKKANQTLNGFSKTAFAVAGKIGAVGAALAGLAGAAGLVSLTKNSMKAIDETAKLSDELQISTERLVGFQHAAAITGISSETLNKGLQRFTRNIGEAKKGYGEGATAIKRMGVSLSELSKLNGADAIELIADKIKEMPDAASRAAAAYAMFGRSGQQLMNFLLLGKDGMSAMQKEAEALGLTFSRIDAAQVEEANDAMTRVGESIQGVGNVIAIKLAPFIEAASMKFVEMATSGEGVGSKVGGAMETVVKSIAAAADSVALLKAAFYSLKTVFQKISETIVKTFSTMMEPFLRFADYIPESIDGGALSNLRDTLKNWGNNIAEDAQDSVDNVHAAWRQFEKGEYTAKANELFNEIRKNSKEKAEKIADEIAKLNSGMNLPDIDMEKTGKKGNVGDKFAQTNLGLIALNGTAGMQSGREQDVKARGVESRLDKIAGILTNQGRMQIALAG